MLEKAVQEVALELDHRPAGRAPSAACDLLDAPPTLDRESSAT